MKYNVFMAAVLLLFLATDCPEAAGKFYGSGSSDALQISITFDDGPGPATMDILGILHQYEVKAAFFMLGKNALKRPHIAQEVLSRGHEIGNHTYSHPNLYKYKDTIPKDVLDNDIKLGADALYRSTGYIPRYVRIPHGYYRSWVSEVAKKNNVDVVHWTFGCDWQKLTKKEMIDAYVEAVKPGAILLFHDGGGYKRRKKTISILPIIIEKIRKKGYRIIPLHELINPSTDK